MISDPARLSFYLRCEYEQERVFVRVVRARLLRMGRGFVRMGTSAKVAGEAMKALAEVKYKTFRPIELPSSSWVFEDHRIGPMKKRRWWQRG